MGHKLNKKKLTTKVFMIINDLWFSTTGLWEKQFQAQNLHDPSLVIGLGSCRWPVCTTMCIQLSFSIYEGITCKRPLCSSLDSCMILSNKVRLNFLWYTYFWRGHVGRIFRCRKKRRLESRVCLGFAFLLLSNSGQLLHCILHRTLQLFHFS